LLLRSRIQYKIIKVICSWAIEIYKFHAPFAFLSNTYFIFVFCRTGAHHVDLRFATSEDPKWLQDVRKREVSIIAKWLSEYYDDLDPAYWVIDPQLQEFIPREFPCFKRIFQQMKLFNHAAILKQTVNTLNFVVS